MKIKLLLPFLFLSCFANAQYTKLFDFLGESTTGSVYYGSLITDSAFLYGMTYNGGTNQMGSVFRIKPDSTGFLELYNFSGPDGANPFGSLLFDGTFLYGMTNGGGTNNLGVIFKILPDGTGYTKLLDFTGTANGSNPYGSLISDGTFLYGMTRNGGANNQGTVFKIMADGTGYVDLLDFNGANGGNPYGDLFSDGSFLYGMTTSGGATSVPVCTSGCGVLFKIKPDGTNYSKLHDFSGMLAGSKPFGTLVSDGTFLYGMTSTGGTSSPIDNRGMIFKIKPDGTGFTDLFNFSGTATGLIPYGSLVYDGTFLYGMASTSGSNNAGTIFKLMPDGSNFTKLLDFAGKTNGSKPHGSLFYDGTFLYGMTYSGGKGWGTMIKIMPDGSMYSKMHDFTLYADGWSPRSTLATDGTFLYGMTNQGGSSATVNGGGGTLFKIKYDGTGYVKLLNFENDSNHGYNPYGSLFSDGIFLYGMTQWGAGSVFKIKHDGTGYSKLLTFSGLNGSRPFGSLISDGTFLYGMTCFGGANDLGVIFKIKPDGTGYANLLDFSGTANGKNPFGSLFFDGTFLYGMTYNGGVNNLGLVFKIKPDGTEYANLMDFTGAVNGAIPNGSLISDGTFLYGMTVHGGVQDSGTIFKIKPDGTGYAKLHDFMGTPDGAQPLNDLFYDGNFLYGMTYKGGTANLGIIFRIRSDGTAYSKLLDFSGSTNGMYLFGSFISDGTSLYGTTGYGGKRCGTIFKFRDTTTTGIVGNYLSNDFTISPNPFSVQTTLQTDKGFKGATLTVYNLYGQTVKQIDNLSGQTITLHRENLSNGLYFLRLTQDNKIITVDKLVITDK